MAAFTPDETDWQRLDYAAIAVGGLATVTPDRREECRKWLENKGYALVTLDCTGGFAAVCGRLSALFDWPGQFGYEFQGHSLDALWDGFTFEIPDAGGLVLELLHPEALLEAKPAFVEGLLRICSDYSHLQIVEGRRFLALIVTEGSTLPGMILGPGPVVPHPGR